MPSSTSTWWELLAQPGAGNHVAVIYRHADELSAAAARFVGAGLAHREGVLVIATSSGWGGLVRRLCEAGIDAAAAERQGQLIRLDASESLARLARRQRPTSTAFRSLLGGVQALRWRYRGVRVFSELVDVLSTSSCWTRAVASCTSPSGP
jgi:hypothetical protein